MKSKKAVILLSGGLDSATVLYYAKKHNYICSCLIFDYGQKHSKELKSAVKIAKLAKCKYEIVNIRLPWGGSSLLGKSGKIPFGVKLLKDELPSTYVPGRNTIFIAHALSFAEAIKADAIFIGANALDYSGYPDCRPQYLAQWQKLVNSLGFKIEIKAPLVNLYKSQIIKLGIKLGVPYRLTWSCYSGSGRPCGKFDSCRFRAKGFIEAGLSDPALLKL